MTFSAFQQRDAEFEADLWAVESLLKVAGDDFKAQTLTIMSPFLMFTIFDMLARFYKPRNEIAVAMQASHPSYAERAAHLRDFAERQAQIPISKCRDLMIKVEAFLREETAKAVAKR